MKKIFIFMILSLIMIPTLTYAWGIAFAEDHFTLKQGEKYDVKFGLQNYVGDESKRIIIELSGDKEIATVLNKKDYYLLPPKTKDYDVLIQVSIPKPAKKNYKVDVNFIAYPGSGGISLATAKVIPIYIEVPDGTLTEEPKETPLDLSKTYQDVEEVIEKEEGKAPTTKVQGLAILETKDASNLLPIVLMIAGLLVLLISVTIYFQKKRKRELGLT